MIKLQRIFCVNTLKEGLLVSKHLYKIIEIIVFLENMGMDGFALLKWQEID